MWAGRSKRPVRIVLGRQSGGHLHNSFTLCRPYALRMQPYAVRMHFLPERQKPIKSRAERTSSEPYALYAAVFGVGAFLRLFLLREVHTAHTTAYGIGLNLALALLPVGIEASTARETHKCIRDCIRLSTTETPYRPPSKSAAGGRSASHSPTNGADAWGSRHRNA